MRRPTGSVQITPCLSPPSPLSSVCLVWSGLDPGQTGCQVKLGQGVKRGQPAESSNWAGRGSQRAGPTPGPHASLTSPELKSHVFGKTSGQLRAKAGSQARPRDRATESSKTLSVKCNSTS
ncbi:hypothetical protein AAFF_G00441020 [Aldrovandia affinis]|uniref:Uncharacterized protein n=1 Tax=Aldrovandia affinis TaxID=143900 RepID=A0AAD7S7E3_9TELE|nr:hypothetical protein AAFF_G00441020 [Aldrovandia affinis]